MPTAVVNAAGIPATPSTGAAKAPTAAPAAVAPREGRIPTIKEWANSAESEIA